MKLLDLYCGAGGASMGYHRAGFEVVGVDHVPQSHYPFEFIQADALEYLAEHGHEYDAIHASPPCHAYSTVTPRIPRRKHRKYSDLVAPTRELLSELLSLPWVIENVVGAPLRFAITLCGSSFGLDVRRHRLFESNIMFMARPCEHWRQTPRFRSLDSRQKTLACVIGVHGQLNYSGEFALRQRAMGIDWMNNKELTQAIPPAYTQWLGGQLLSALREKQQ